MSNRCKLCQTEITEGGLRAHIISTHGEHAPSVEQAYPNLYEELFEDGTLRTDLRSQTTPGGEQPRNQSTEQTERVGRPADADTQTRRSGPQGPQHGRDEPHSPGDVAGDDARQTGSSPTHPRPSGGTRRTETAGGRHSDTGGEEHAETRENIDRGTSKKWLVIGIGGAGNHILDTMLMRRDTLAEQNHSLADVWEEGIADYLSLNTNNSEVYGTYYAQVDKEYSREALERYCMIGFNQHTYSGTGRDWRRGRDFMQHDFDGEQNALVERWDIDRQSLRGAQAVMLVHSVTKGTGCGATPVLAENICEMLESSGPGGDGSSVKPVLSSVVLPSEDTFGGGNMVRGVIGIARLSKAVDGILPFDNSQLEQIRDDLAVEVRSEWLQYNPPQYQNINRLLVSFLEGFTMSSTPISYDASATMRISGDMFDVPDSIRPAVQKYPTDIDLEYDPAVVMVPVLGRHDSPSTEQDLDTLVRSTLLQGQFIDFDPGTAWGGTFMIFGPDEKMENLSPLLADNRVKSILGGQDFFDRASTGPGESVDIYVDRLVVPQVDSVHLWGLVWNPQLPTLESMYEYAEAVVNNRNNRQAAALKDVWDNVESVFEHLGRENMG